MNLKLNEINELAQRMAELSNEASTIADQLLEAKSNNDAKGAASAKLWAHILLKRMKIAGEQTVELYNMHYDGATQH